MITLLAGLKILIVEDDRMSAALIECIAAEFGCHSTTVATTVEEALMQIRMQSFDAATLDGDLYGLKSFPVADELVARAIPFFFATGRLDHRMREDYGEGLILIKPFGLTAMNKMFVRILPFLSGGEGAEVGPAVPMSV